MAGVQDSINIEFDGDAIEQLLYQLQSKTNNLQPAMLEISEYLHLRSRENFDNAESPDGIPWDALNTLTTARKIKQGVPILSPLHGESLHLRDTIFPFANDTEAGISTGPGTSDYAATHQFGDVERNIEARPYLGLSEADEVEILEIISEYLELDS